MRSLSPGLCNDTNDIVLIDPSRNGGGQFLRQQNGAGRSIADFYFLDSEKNCQKSGFDITDIGCSLPHHLVFDVGKHVDKHIADAFKRSLCTLSFPDQALCFSGHIRILDHGHMAQHDLCFLFTGRRFQCFCLSFRLMNEFLDCFLEAQNLLFGIFHLGWCVFQRHLFDQHDCADANAF